MAWDGAGLLPEFPPVLLASRRSGPEGRPPKVATLGTTGYPTMKTQPYREGRQVQFEAAGELIAEDSARVLFAHLIGDARP